MSSTSPQGERPLRADARHNFDVILQVARELFAEQGYEASISEVGRRSGLGMGTIYRHFENKTVLMERIAISAMEETLAEVQQVLAGEPDSWGGFCHVMRHLVRNRSSQLRLRGRATTPGPALGKIRGELLGALDDLVARTQHAGLLRTDVNAVDIVLLLDSIPPNPPASDVDTAQRHLAVILDGLRQPGREVLVTPAPGPVEIDHYFHRTHGL